MGFLDFFKPHKYDMDTLDGILSIPVPATNYNTGDPTKDCIYYVLQRKATEHKKNGKMDLAIACLKKSNELSDFEVQPLLLEKDYLRLVKYLKLAGKNDEANIEFENIYNKNPQFKDKRISNLPKIKKALQNQVKWKNDLVSISTNNSCPICKKYNTKIYSISGKSKKYPLLPSQIVNEGGFCLHCYISVGSYFDGISQKTT